MTKRKPNKRWDYKGPVMKFDICVERNWNATTWAPTEKKARNNLAFRYARDHDMIGPVKIVLPGKLETVE